MPLWPDENGIDATLRPGFRDEADWLWCDGVRFRAPSWFIGWRVCALPSDAVRCSSGLLAYTDELALRIGPWYHPEVAAPGSGVIEFYAGPEILLSVVECERPAGGA
eukprot:IDg22956t1